MNSSVRHLRASTHRAAQAVRSFVMWSPTRARVCVAVAVTVLALPITVSLIVGQGAQGAWDASPVSEAAGQRDGLRNGRTSTSPTPSPSDPGPTVIAHDEALPTEGTGAVVVETATRAFIRVWLGGRTATTHGAWTDRLLPLTAPESRALMGTTDVRSIPTAGLRGIKVTSLSELDATTDITLSDGTTLAAVLEYDGATWLVTDLGPKEGTR